MASKRLEERREELLDAGAAAAAAGPTGGEGAAGAADVAAGPTGGGGAASGWTTLRGRPRTRTLGAARRGSTAADGTRAVAAGTAGNARTAGAAGRRQAAQCHSSSGERRRPAHLRWATAGQVEQQSSRRLTRRVVQSPQSRACSPRKSGVRDRLCLGASKRDEGEATKSNTSERASETAAAEPLLEVPDR